MMATQAKPLPAPRQWWKIALRVLGIVAVAACIGWGLNHSIGSLVHGTQPAGFWRGMLHGALMPLALPNLLVGHDVVIYSTNNTGRLYKLGYTAGVNGCGLIFFGLLFWRLSRWRRDTNSK
jgi:hypothetical protein